MQLAPFPTSSSASGPVLPGVNSYFRGYNLRETSGSSSAACQVWGNGPQQTQLLASIGLTAGESADVTYRIEDRGQLFVNGLFLTVESGEVEGFVRYD